MTGALILPPQCVGAAGVRLPRPALLPRALGASEVAAAEARLALTELSDRVTARPGNRSIGRSQMHSRGRGARR